MSAERIWRLVALASYGTRFLRGANELEDWYRHFVFWDALQQFRDAGTRRLLYSDFPAFLMHARERGATRLSLLPRDDLAPPDGLVGSWDSHMLVLQFESHYERWVCGDELDAADAWRLGLPMEAQCSLYLPNARHYAAGLDCHWRLSDGAGRLELEQTDWHDLKRRLLADLKDAGVSEPPRLSWRPVGVSQAIAA